MKRVFLLSAILFIAGCGAGKHISGNETEAAKVVESGNFRLSIEEAYVYPPYTHSSDYRTTPGYGSEIVVENGHAVVRLSPEAEIIHTKALYVNFFERKATIAKIKGYRYRIDFEDGYPDFFRDVYIDFTIDKASNICHGTISSRNKVNARFKGTVQPMHL